MKNNKSNDKKEKGKNGCEFSFSCDELEIAKYLFTLKDTKYPETGSSTFSIIKNMWDNGYNSVLVPVAKYLLFERGIEPKDMKKMLYRYLAYASYTVRMANDINSKSNLVIDEFKKLKEKIDSSSIGVACNKMFEFLKSGKVDENKTESRWAWHFNNGIHPAYKSKNKEFKDIYTQEEKDKYWRNIEKDKSKMAAGIDLFIENTDPLYAFQRTSDPKKFDVIIAEALQTGRDWYSFTFEIPSTTDKHGLDSNIKCDRKNPEKLIACILDHILRKWDKDAETNFKPNGSLGFRNLSDYKMLSIDKNFNFQNIVFIDGDAINWEAIEPFKFKYKASDSSSDSFRGKMHSYRIAKDGIERLD